MDQVEAHVAALTRQALSGLGEIPAVRLLSPDDGGTKSIVSFDVRGVHPHDVAQVAAARGVAVRAGHHCCQPLMRELGLAGTVRASFGVYNDAGDVAALVDSVRESLRLFC